MTELDLTLDNFAQAIANGAPPPPQMNADYPHYSLATALEVYRNNYRGNLHDALASAYPVLRQLVGDEFFRFMARRFIERHPSRSGNLIDYGAELADFLTRFAPAQTLAYLPDLAALEWACQCAYFAADAAPPDFSRLAQIPPEQHSDLIVRVDPACRLIGSAFPIVAIWQMHQPDSVPVPVSERAGGETALVSRADNRVQVSALTAAEAGCLQALLDGRTLGEATALALNADSGFDLSAALQSWQTLKLLLAFEC